MKFVTQTSRLLLDSLLIHLEECHCLTGNGFAQGQSMTCLKHLIDHSEIWSLPISYNVVKFTVDDRVWDVGFYNHFEAVQFCIKQLFEEVPPIVV